MCHIRVHKSATVALLHLQPDAQRAQKGLPLAHHLLRLWAALSSACCRMPSAASRTGAPPPHRRPPHRSAAPIGRRVDRSRPLLGRSRAPACRRHDVPLPKPYCAAAGARPSTTPRGRTPSGARRLARRRRLVWLRLPVSVELHLPANRTAAASVAPSSTAAPSAAPSAASSAAPSAAPPPSDNAPGRSRFAGRSPARGTRPARYQRSWCEAGGRPPGGRQRAPCTCPRAACRAGESLRIGPGRAGSRTGGP